MGLSDGNSGLVNVAGPSQEPPPDHRVYFKIHGSADHPDSLVFTLRAESRLAAWKRRLMSRCINGRPLLVVGYSGLDFEICPEISRLHPTVVAWNFLTPDDSARPGPAYLSEHGAPLTGLIGGMDLLFDLLGHAVGRLIPSSAASDVARMIRGLFAPEELLLWRARLLNTMGFCRLSATTLDDMKMPRIGAAAREYAQSLFQQGAYKRSSRLFLERARLESEPRSAIAGLLDASDAARCFGDLPQSWLLILKAERLAETVGSDDPLLRCGIGMKKLLLLQEAAKCVPGATWLLRTGGIHLFRNGVAAASESGDWLAFQQFALLAERWSIPVSALGCDDSFEPPPTRDGYRHLGYVIGELLHLLDRTRCASSHVECDALARALQIAVRLGSHPTAWKIAARIAARFPDQRPRYRLLHQYHLGACEYNYFSRWRNGFAR